MQDGSFSFNNRICEYVKKNIEFSAYLCLHNPDSKLNKNNA